MKIREDFYYFTKNGEPAVVLQTADIRAIEDYILDRVSAAIDWTPYQITSKFAVDRYLWGRTPKQAIQALVNDCQRHDNWQRT